MSTNTRPWKILLLTAALASGVFGLAFLLFADTEHHPYNSQITHDLAIHAQMIGDHIAGRWPALDAADTNWVQRHLPEDAKFAVLTASGVTVIADVDSEGIARTSEFEATLRNGASHVIRRWGPEGRLYVVATARTGSDADELGVIWVARPAWTVTSDRYSIARLVTASTTLVITMAAITWLILNTARRRMLYRLARGARQLSEGDVRADLEVTTSDELAPLMSSLSALRRRLIAQLDTIDRQRRMLETLVNHLDEGVVLVQEDARISLINPAAARLLNVKLGPEGVAGLAGRAVETCIPQHPIQRLLLPQDDVIDVRVDHEAASRRPIAVDSADRKRFLLANASTLTLTDPGDPTARAQTCRMVVLTDVTELQRTIQLRTDFVANASHELRTPLATIRAAVETLQSMDLHTEADAARQFLQAIDRHSDRLQDLVGDLLDLSRVEAPTKQFEPESLSVRMIFDELQSRFADVLQRKQLNWRVTSEPADGATIFVNPQLLRLALNNLVDNASKFTPEGGEISVTFRRSVDAVEFIVRDTGCGIPEEECERVFERFYQVERGRSGAARGTGLGLSIVRHAVTAAKGSVTLESRPGAGTCVTISLPQPPLPRR